MLINKITNNRDDWVLRDYVRDCEEDIKLDVVADSIEVKQRGGIRCAQPRTIDLGASSGRRLERIPDSIMNEVLGSLEAILS